MKRMFFVIIALAMMFAGGVQQVYAKGKAAPVRALEFEIGAGMVSPTNKLDFDKNRVGYNINAELRCNFKTHPFDIGLRVDGGTFHRTLKLNKDLFKFRSLNVMAVFDWNINRKGIFSPYLGIGIGGGITSNQGMSIKDVANQPFKETVSSAAFCVMPRVGVEIFHRARATLYYKHIKDANSHFGLSVGIVFGGGRK